LGVTIPESRVGWRGFHHVAVVTRDLKETARFYGEVLGMSVGDLIERDAQGTVSRHRFIRPGGDESWGLHVFASLDAKPHPLAHSIDRDNLMGTVGVQHIAFALPDEAAGIELRERLRESGVESTAIGSVGPIGNTLFFDNNGLLLEATWPKP
jgi:catechol 2,3-dioxygenase-like lactoylglutathione lyase family enzyme